VTDHEAMHSVRKMVVQTITSVMACVTVATMSFLGYTTSKSLILTHFCLVSSCEFVFHIYTVKVKSLCTL
jgi:hypothetical protein